MYKHLTGGYKMRRTIKKKKASNIKKVILQHINNNLKDYTVLILFFLVGIILGVIFINNADNVKQEQISKYINGMISSLKEDYVIDNSALLKSSIADNIKLAVLLWFARFYRYRCTVCLWDNSI